MIRNAKKPIPGCKPYVMRVQKRFDRFPFRYHDIRKIMNHLSRLLLLPFVFFGGFTACVKNFPDSNLFSLLMLQPNGNTSTIATPGFAIDASGGLFVAETLTTATFTVALKTKPTASVSVTVGSGDTTEGTVSPTSLTFTPTNWNTAQTVTVTGVDDAIVDGNIVFNIAFGAAASTDTSYNGTTPASVSAMNVDNDTILGTANILVNPTSGLKTSETPLSTANFTVVMQAQPTANVTNCLSVSDTTEVALTAGGGVVADAGCAGGFSITFTPLDWSTARTVTVTGVDDALWDGAQPFTVSFAADITTTDVNYNGLIPSSVTGNNNDNDTVGITTTTPVSTSEAGTTASFTVVLDSQPAGSVTLSVASSLAAEGLVKTQAADPYAATAVTPLTFTVANWNVPQTVWIQGQNDLPPAVDGNINYTIDLTPGGADANYTALGVQSVAATNNDDDAAGVTVVGGPFAITEAGANTSYTVVLNTAPSALVKICLSMSDATAANFVIAGNVLAGDASCPEARLEFTAANWSTVQTVTIAPIDDNIRDGAQPFTVGMATSTADVAYNAISIASLTGSTADNEAAASYIVNAGAGLVTNENGLQDSFTVKLSTEPISLVKICVSIPVGSAGEVQLILGGGHLLATDVDCPTGGRLEFDATNWSSAQYVYVQGLGDLVADGTQPYTVTLTKVTTDPNYSLAALTSPTGNNFEYLTPLPVVATTVANTASPSDICVSNDLGDNITAVRIVPISATQVTIEVDFIPPALGYTTTDGDDLKLFLNNTTAGTFTEIADWLMIPLAFTASVTNTRAIVYTLPVLPPGIHYIRAAIIDRAGPTDQLNASCATGSSGTVVDPFRHFDNVDAGFIQP